MKLKHFIITCIICFLIVIIYITITYSSRVSDENNYHNIIEQICLDTGYEIEFEDENDFGDNTYLNSYFNIPLDDSGYDLQININEPSIGNTTIEISICKEIYSPDNARAGLSEHYTLFVNLINAFSEDDISEEMISSFFEDSSNIEREYEYYSDWNEYYLIRKSADLNPECGILYVMTAHPGEYDLSDYSYIEGDCIMEELSIGTYDMYLKNM